MKSKFIILTATLLSISLLAGCGQTETASNAEAQTTETSTESTATQEQSKEPTPTEEPHTHNYVEAITTESTCEADGLKTFTCECGDSYTEAIIASGHIYENYIYNEDATYLADGTETATCVCGLTDTRTKEGSKLEYTYTDMEATMYAQQTVNVRDLPSTDGNKVGSLSTNDEVKVTGQAETGWYRIEFEDSVAYVSDKYLGYNKVEVQQSTNSGGSGSGNSGGSTASAVPNPYELPLQTWVDLGDWMLYIHPANESPDPCVNSAFWENQRAILQERYPDKQISGRLGITLDNGTYSAWYVSVYDGFSADRTHGVGYPQLLLDFIVKYQY